MRKKMKRKKMTTMMKIPIEDKEEDMNDVIEEDFKRTMDNTFEDDGE